jgi:hypothetical protein
MYFTLLYSFSLRNTAIVSSLYGMVWHDMAQMKELGIPRSGGKVVFGQLLGMCDHVSFSLGMLIISSTH